MTSPAEQRRCSQLTEYQEQSKLAVIMICAEALRLKSLGKTIRAEIELNEPFQCPL